MRVYPFSYFKPVVYIGPGRHCGKTMMQHTYISSLIDAGYSVRCIRKEDLKNTPKIGLKIPYTFVDKDIIGF